LRTPIKLKPFLSTAAATIDLVDFGNEYFLLPKAPTSQTYKQTLSIIPADESELYCENHDGQFFRLEGSSYDVGVKHTFYKDDLRIAKHLFNFEIDIPALSGILVVARFKGRLRRGKFSTVLKNEGMWKYCPGGERGDLHVELTVK
jgi:hypothetical protein